MGDLNGKSIKGYELRDRIGAGGFGAVYRAYQSTLRREVAVKIILPGYANQPAFIRRFETEAQLIARLEHPHIVPLYDFWRDPQGAYLVMRYLKGGNLKDMLAGGPCDLESTANLLDQIAAALTVAHRNKIIHRDIKPSNILLDEDGNTYLADFGIAKNTVVEASLTAPDALVGSPDYLAPEQARSEPVSPQTDIYSLGVVLYELLTGQHPFPGLSSIERLFAHLNEPLPPVTVFDGGIGENVNTVIGKATAKNPASRYSDVMTLARAFREAAALGASQMESSLVERLTPREQEILALIIEGKSNREIADAFVLEISTIKWHINQLYKKLKVRSRVQAIVKARELNLIADGFVQTAAPVTQTGLPEPDNPYKGLRAFTAADEQDFFGRDRLIRSLLDRLGDRDEYARFLAVVGPSGSGKSSLVRAGLIPALWRGELTGSDRWYIVDMIPGTRPLDELEIALTRIATDQSVNLSEHLRRDGAGLLRAAQLVLPDDGSELLVVIDQFEETFSLIEDEQRRAHFLALIHTAVTDPHSRVRVVITMRADFYDRPLQYPQFGELIRRRMVTVLPMNADEVAQAIRRPAERVGVRFEVGLVTAIVSEVNYQPGALPLLQYALTELFEQREDHTLTRAGYQLIGGATGALASRAEGIYREFAIPRQGSIRQMFLRLITLGEGVEDTRRRVPRSELLELASEPDAMDEIIDTYTAYRLLSLDHDPATRRPTVEVAHEALLQEWERLSAWLEESRTDIRMQRQLARAAGDWQEANEDPSFLLRGAHLEQFEGWSAVTDLALTQVERGYLEACLALRDEEAAVEAEQQAREAALRKRVQRVLTTLLAVFVVAPAVGLVLAVDARHQRDAALNARATSAANEAAARSSALLAEANLAQTRGDTSLALALALEAQRSNDSLQVISNLYELAYQPGARRRFAGHEDWIEDLAISADGHTAISCSVDGTLILWDLDTGDIIRRFEGSGGRMTSVALSQDGQHVVAGSQLGILTLWDLRSGDVVWQSEGHAASVSALIFGPNDENILSASADQTLILWDVDSGRELRRFEGHTSPVLDAAISPDGQTVLSVSIDGTLIVWDLDTGQPLRQSAFDMGILLSLAISPDGTTALIGSKGGDLVLWDLEMGQILHRFERTGPILDVVFSPDGSQAAVGTGEPDLAVIIWDVETGAESQRFNIHSPVNAVRFLPDSRSIVTGSQDTALLLWDLVEYKPHVYDIDYAPGNAFWFQGPIRLSADSRRALAVTEEGFSAVLWDIDTGNILQEFDMPDRAFWGLDLSPDGRLTVTGDGSGLVTIWDTQTGSVLDQFKIHDDRVNEMEILEDGRTVVSVSDDGTAKLWDLQSGEVMRSFEGHPGGAHGFDMSPDGSRLLVGSIGYDYRLILWDVESGETIRVLTGHTSGVGHISISPDGHMALSGSYENEPILWDLDTGEMIRRLSGHQDTTPFVKFLPDGQHALTGSLDGTVILWDVATGTALYQMQPPGPTSSSDIARTNWVQGLEVSPNGHFAMIGYVSRVSRWDITPITDWIAANRYVPEFTCEQREQYSIEPLCDEGEPIGS